MPTTSSSPKLNKTGTTVFSLFSRVRVDTRRRGELAAFAKAIGVRFKDADLLDLALTHRSRSSETDADGKPVRNNEKLEFLGDAVLGVIVASHLYARLADRAEGDLARVKSYVVSEDTLSALSSGLGVDKVLRMGKGEEMSGGRSKKAILADALEAVIGACYLDQGFRKAEAFVLELLVPEVDKVLSDKHKKDYKTLVQEFVQKYYKTFPVYSLVKRTGPDHDRVFWMTCQLAGKEYGPAHGKTKKEAEQGAAALAYEAIIQAGGPDADRLRQFK